MLHDSSDMMDVIIKIGSMLGLQKHDIDKLKKIGTNNEITNLQRTTLQCPTNCYKDTCGGYYGTISIKNFY